MSVKYGRSSPAPPTPIEQSQSPCLPKETLPTMYDLKSESPEEPGLPDEYHLWQAELCSKCRVGIAVYGINLRQLTRISNAHHELSVGKATLEKNNKVRFR
ncbi:MAG: hypothetical protein SVX43_13320 [Cyanobacteriota bacterium]|nr:hypothetical protein [Cyanobacteriota bacterium]